MNKDQFHRAARDGFLDLLKETTRKDCNHPDEDGFTPTIWAAYSGRLDALRLLVGRGGNPDKCDLFGNSALHWSSANGHFDCVTFLVNFGCDIWLLNNDFQTAKEFAGIRNQKIILDNVMAKQSSINPKNVQKSKEKAVVEAEKRIKLFEKLQRKTTKKVEKEEKLLERNRHKLFGPLQLINNHSQFIDISMKSKKETIKSWASTKSLNSYSNQDLPLKFSDLVNTNKNSSKQRTNQFNCILENVKGTLNGTTSSRLARSLGAVSRKVQLKKQLTLTSTSNQQLALNTLPSKNSIKNNQFLSLNKKNESLNYSTIKSSTGLYRDSDIVYAKKISDYNSSFSDSSFDLNKEFDLHLSSDDKNSNKSLFKNFEKKISSSLKSIALHKDSFVKSLDKNNNKKNEDSIQKKDKILEIKDKSHKNDDQTNNNFQMNNKLEENDFEIKDNKNSNKSKIKMNDFNEEDIQIEEKKFQVKENQINENSKNDEHAYSKDSFKKSENTNKNVKTIKEIENTKITQNQQLNEDNLFKKSFKTKRTNSTELYGFDNTLSLKTEKIKNLSRSKSNSDILQQIKNEESFIENNKTKELEYLSIKEPKFGSIFERPGFGSMAFRRNLFAQVLQLSKQLNEKNFDNSSFETQNTNKFCKKNYSKNNEIIHKTSNLKLLNKISKHYLNDLTNDSIGNSAESSISSTSSSVSSNVVETELTDDLNMKLTSKSLFKTRKSIISTNSANLNIEDKNCVNFNRFDALKKSQNNENNFKKDTKLNSSNNDPIDYTENFFKKENNLNFKDIQKDFKSNVQKEIKNSNNEQTYKLVDYSFNHQVCKKDFYSEENNQKTDNESYQIKLGKQKDLKVDIDEQNIEEQKLNEKVIWKQDKQSVDLKKSNNQSTNEKDIKKSINEHFNNKKDVNKKDTNEEATNEKNVNKQNIKKIDVNKQIINEKFFNEQNIKNENANIQSTRNENFDEKSINKKISNKQVINKKSSVIKNIEETIINKVLNEKNFYQKDLIKDYNKQKLCDKKKTNLNEELSDLKEKNQLTKINEKKMYNFNNENKNEFYENNLKLEIEDKKINLKNNQFIEDLDESWQDAGTEIAIEKISTICAEPNYEIKKRLNVKYSNFKKSTPKFLDSHV